MPIRRRSPPFPQFADLRLGKEVVFARDTPNFIANRIGVFIMLEAVRLMQEEDLTIEEVDALTGTAIGWPRTGTFRLADLVGIDVLAHVAANFEGSGACCRRSSRLCSSAAGWATRPSRASTRKRRTSRRQGDPLVLDWKTLEYQFRRSGPRFPRSRWPRTPSGSGAPGGAAGAAMFAKTRPRVSTGNC
jgi:3-hydroxyacyl-CoA dehydrogenase